MTPRLMATCPPEPRATLPKVNKPCKRISVNSMAISMKVVCKNKAAYPYMRSPKWDT